MGKYISKASVVAEIERRINKEIQSSATDSILGYSQGCVDSMRNVLSLIDTLEVKEVDLEKEIYDAEKRFGDIDEMGGYRILIFDDEILQAISIGLADAEKDLGWSDFGGLPIEEIQEWLEKQGDKSVNIDIESMVSSYKQRLKSQGGVENTPLVNMCLTAFRQGVENVLDELSLKKLEKQVEKKPASSEKTCKNDTLLDLLHKIPSCITVDGIDYHFVMKKTIAYMAFYEGEGEGSGKVIFWMTAYSPIDLLNEMLEKLKKEGLLE